jgi:hypothetical protein
MTEIDCEIVKQNQNIVHIKMTVIKDFEFNSGFAK